MNKFAGALTLVAGLALFSGATHEVQAGHNPVFISVGGPRGGFSYASGFGYRSGNNFRSYGWQDRDRRVLRPSYGRPAERPYYYQRGYNYRPSCRSGYRY